MVTTSHRFTTTSHRFAATSHRFTVASHRFAAASHRFVTTSHRFAATSHRFTAASHRFAVASHRFTAASHRFAAASHRFAAASHRFTAASHRFTAASHRFAAASHRFTAVTYRFLQLQVWRQTAAILFFYTFAEKLNLGRILGIDYGQKRVGLAVTDELRMIAGPLTTVHSKDVIAYLKEYVSHENVDCFVVGYPLTLQNQPSESARFTEPFVKHLQKIFPDIPVERIDERFTSKMATAAILFAGAKKKDRQGKSLVDKVSAVIILQSYLEMKDLQT